MSDITVNITKIPGGKTLTFSRAALNADDLKAFDFTDEYQSACAVMFALARWEQSPGDSTAMLDVVMGPESPNAFTKDFIKGQFSQYPYVVRSYFEGAAVANSYAVPAGNLSLTFKENPYSREQDGYVKLFVRSAGADSDRSVTLRKKGSTGEWFLFSDSYKGLLAGIRVPANKDPWA